MLLLFAFSVVVNAQETVYLSQASVLEKPDGYFPIKERVSQKVAESRTFKVIHADRSSKVRSQFGGITIQDDHLFFKLKLNNRSNINYDVDFIRFYIRDLKTAKRTVTQEQELHPVYSYGLNDRTIEGKTSAIYVFALSKFPISKDQALFAEVYEKNGGRHLYLKARHKDIGKARAYK